MSQKQPGVSGKSRTSSADDMLRQLAFDNSLRANLISIVSSGKIIMANRAARQLLGYSKKEILTKSRSLIFDITDIRFKKMLKERTAEGQSEALLTAIKKNGKHLQCRVTSAVFTDTDGIKKAITTIADRSQSILKQKEIDGIKEKEVTDNIAIANSKQKNIDIRNEKIVADHIDIAKKKSDARLEQNNQWMKHIAKTSYDVMWDWHITSGEMYIGDSIGEVFGYKVKNNSMKFTDFIGFVLPKEKEAVEKRLYKALASGKKSWSDSYLFKRYDGSIASTITRASIIRDENGKAVHLIGNIQDTTKLVELEKKLKEQDIIRKENSDIFRLAAELSYDGIWDWNILTNEFFLGNGFKEIFGDSLKNKDKMNRAWSNHLHPDDKEAVEKGMREAMESGGEATTWAQSYRFIKKNGSIVNVFCRANIIRDSNGKAVRMIGAVHDLTRQKILEKKLYNKIAAQSKLLIGYEESFRFILNSSSDIFYDADLVTSKITLSDAYQKQFGYRITNNSMYSSGWLKHIHPDEKIAVIADYNKALASEDTEWKYTYRFLRADNTIANVLNNGIILRHSDGKAYRMIGIMFDMSKQIIIEKNLEAEIKLKEKQISEAMIDAKETERSDIGKELHDNVNQLLGASKLYLDMAKRGGADSEMYLSRSSEYTLMAIDEIRKLTRGMTTDNIKTHGLCEAIGVITRDTMEVNELKISNALNSFKEDSVNNKFKLNVFRIIQEQLNNIIKHARATKVAISLLQNEKSIKLTITDNGIGFDTTKKQDGIGVTNIKSRTASFNGKADFISQPGHGCVLSVQFPLSALIA